MRRRACGLWLVAAVLASACNVIEFQERTLEGRLQRADFTVRNIEVPGAFIHLWEGGRSVGASRPLLLIHGFGASGLWQWADQAPELSKRRRVLIPDLRYFGDTVVTGGDHSLDGQVTAMVALLDALGVEQVDVVGISYGGFVAYELAALHPARVGRLVLVDSPGRHYSRANYEAMLKRLHTSDMGALLVPSDVEGVRRLMGLAYERPPPIPGFALQQTLSTLFEPHRADQQAVLTSLVSELDGIASRAGHVRAPTLVVWGEHDPIFTLEEGTLTAQALKAQLVVVPKTKHFVPAEAPSAVNAALTTFLSLAH